MYSLGMYKVKGMYFQSMSCIIMYYKYCMKWTMCMCEIHANVHTDMIWRRECQKLVAIGFPLVHSLKMAQITLVSRVQPPTKSVAVYLVYELCVSIYVLDVLYILHVLYIQYILCVLCVLHEYIYNTYVYCVYHVCKNTHQISSCYATADGDAGGVSQILVYEKTEKRETMNRPSGANSRIESCTE